MEKDWRHKETLHLTLKKEWFDLMWKGDKKIEVRKPSKWIQSRLNKTIYKQVKFTNGYAKDAPFFIVEFLGAEIAQTKMKQIFIGEKELCIEPGDIIIYLGNFIKRSSKPSNESQ